MVIGFASSTQYVNESDAASGSDSFGISIEVATLRMSEIEYGIIYRLLSNATARVVSFEYFQDLDFDARFGTIQGDPIEEQDTLNPGENSRPIFTEVRNDFIPEDEECYSIQISPADIPGLQELFMCGYSGGFFCVHTICIKDDEGNLDSRR